MPTPDIHTMAAVLAAPDIPLADEDACAWALLKARFSILAIDRSLDMARSLATELRGETLDLMITKATDDRP